MKFKQGFIMKSKNINSAQHATPLRLSQNGILRGPYPTRIDVTSDDQFEGPKFFGDKNALRLSNDANVEFLRLQNDLIGLNHLELKNLMSLKVLEVVPESGDFPVRNMLLSEIGFGSELYWITCRDLPQLKTIKLIGSMVSLDIDGANTLVEVDVSNCPNLVNLSIRGAPRLRKVNVAGCLKLQGLAGMSARSKASQDVSRQISEMQSHSRLDGVIYKNMTYFDVNLVLNIINEGIKALSRSGAYPSESVSDGRGSLFGKWSTWAYRESFCPHSFRVLPSNMYFYAAGQRVIYECREGIRHSDRVFAGQPYGDGAITQEECLKNIVNSISATLGDVMDQCIESMSERRFLQYLVAAAKNASYSTPPDISVYLHHDIVQKNKIKYEAALQKMGINVVSKPKKTKCLHVAKDPSSLGAEYDFYSAKSAKPIEEKVFANELKTMANILGFAA